VNGRLLKVVDAEARRKVSRAAVRRNRHLTCCQRSGVIDVGDGLSEFAPLLPGQIDEDDVRVLPHPVEDDLPAVR
jgi:hypothetical protein